MIPLEIGLQSDIHEYTAVVRKLQHSQRTTCKDIETLLVKSLNKNLQMNLQDS